MDPDGDEKVVAELQAVLTRYVDSTEGYAHAARLVSDQGLAPVFLEIGAARAAIIPEVSEMIARCGVEPKEEGSVEGVAHRWWMSARDAVSADDMKTLLEECIRGEKVLLKAIQEALAEVRERQDKDVKALGHAHEDVRKAISHFEAALHDRHFE